MKKQTNLHYATGTTGRKIHIVDVPKDKRRNVSAIGGCRAPRDGWHYSDHIEVTSIADIDPKGYFSRCEKCFSST